MIMTGVFFFGVSGIEMRLRMTCWVWYFILACCWGRTLSIPQQLINEFKTAMLPLFGFKDRPKVDGTKFQVPETLKELYQKQIDYHLDTASIPLPGLHTQSANTIRSFTHVGKHLWHLLFKLSPKTFHMLANWFKTSYISTWVLYDSKIKFHKINSN